VAHIVTFGKKHPVIYPKFAPGQYGSLMTNDGSPAQGTPSFFTDTDALPVVGLTGNEGKVIPRKRVWSWAFWDWATQPFNTVLITFVWVPSFLTSTFFIDPDVVGTAGEDAALGQLASNLGYGITAAGLLIALLAPVLGQRADRTGQQKSQLFLFTALLIAAQLGMVFVQPGAEWFWMGVALIALGSIFGEIAGVSYNALLVSISTPKTVGKVSGLGWGFGYLGGIIALATVVGLILGGVLDGTVASTFQLIALGATIWTVIFVIPLFVNVPEPPKLTAAEKVGFFRSYLELGRSIMRLWKDSRPTFWFLLASAVYRDGLSAVFVFGSVVASIVFGFTFTDLVIFGIALNLVAGVATILAGRLDDRFGTQNGHRGIRVWSRCLHVGSLFPGRPRNANVLGCRADFGLVCRTRPGRITVIPRPGDTRRERGRSVWPLCDHRSGCWLDGLPGVGCVHFTGGKPNAVWASRHCLVLLVGGIMLLFVKAPPRAIR
jgi:UMF1 family MFS transporter